MPLTDINSSEILDSIAEGLFTVDQEFRIQYFNASAERITRLERSAVIGRICRHVFHSEACLFNCPIARVLESGKSIVDFKTVYACKAGETIPVKVNAAVICAKDGRPTGGVVSFRDAAYGGRSADDARTCQESFFGLTGTSRAMQEIFETIREIAPTDATVLIQGETGTGKELAANAIQALSRRKNEKFIKVNCSVLPPQLLASELFGHTKGAFTDAVRDRIGRFEAADGGTIFLDEVAEMPIAMQPQLLRVVQEGTFERVGESSTRRADVRIIAATNVNIRRAMEEGRFRDDLFYRLNVVPIMMPPLRERADDIPLLVRHFMQKFNAVYDKHLTEIDERALRILTSYAWPGNIRELENAVEYAYIRTRHDQALTACALPPSLKGAIPCAPEPSLVIAPRIDRERLIGLLNAHQWNKTKVARIIGVDRTTIWRHLKAMGLHTRDLHAR
ncbi:MAG: sigma-54 interaction domain-containing protein [Acidobacteriota bacterium]